MKNCFIFGLVFNVLIVKGNIMFSDSLAVSQKRISIEGILFPAIFYNALKVGCGYSHSSSFESVLTFSSNMSFIYSPRLSGRLSYNFNVYLAKKKNYIPIWIDLRNIKERWVMRTAIIHIY